MRIIADLHVHSKYSRATSRDMTIPRIAEWAVRKGIGLVGTGDFTHPAHFASIKELLEPDSNGLLKLKGKDLSVRFMLTAEVSNIYTQGGKVRKIHSLIFAPSIEAAGRMNAAFARLGNVASDGRPIFGFSAIDLLRIVLDSSPDAMLVPAHAWTPWFSIFGSKSGFDSIGECFGEYARHIHALETGLSSNPAMNRRLSCLDNITLISNSDAHSPSKLGREANVFDCNMDYAEIMSVIKTNDRKRFLYTVEFYPEEGKYHHDGHRDCGIAFSPDETKKAGGVCPVCNKPLTVGVLHRVSDLADRPPGFESTRAVPARHLVPLEEIVAQSFDMGVSSKKVQHEYARLVKEAGSEFAILLDASEDELVRLAGGKTAHGIICARNGRLSIAPGFDGEFGKIRIFDKAETPTPTTESTGARQERLF
ncbi:MAG: DNA helicase UvrD [Deltaproteobacteria bacterium]|nr:DNA helicase UvrD [Deltaproteobacteria bacterium]